MQYNIMFIKFALGHGVLGVLTTAHLGNMSVKLKSVGN